MASWVMSGASSAEKWFLHSMEGISSFVHERVGPDGFTLLPGVTVTPESFPIIVSRGDRLTWADLQAPKGTPVGIKLHFEVHRLFGRATIDIPSE